METLPALKDKTQNISELKLNVGFPKRSSAKLTPAKRKKFLSIYANTANKSKAALEVGVTLSAIYELMYRDERFKAAIKEIDEHFGQHIEAISVNLAVDASREGFQDRKLQLQRIYPEKYNPSSNTTVNVQVVNNNTSVPEIRKILDDNAILVDTE